MSVQVTIETASKAEAELIAAMLGMEARAESWRGYGVIRLGPRTPSETKQVIESVAEGVARHTVSWARVRYDDDERFFRANERRNTSTNHGRGQGARSSSIASGSGSPAIR